MVPKFCFVVYLFKMKFFLTTENVPYRIFLYLYALNIKINFLSDHFSCFYWWNKNERWINIIHPKVQLSKIVSIGIWTFCQQRIYNGGILSNLDNFDTLNSHFYISFQTSKQLNRYHSSNSYGLKWVFSRSLEVTAFTK